MKDNYWDERYANDSTSGEGSIGSNRDWKWNVVERFVPFYSSVLDVGCGDLSFWEGRECEDYTGIDISKTVIENNINRRPKWKFICENAGTRIENLKKEVVFCFDVLFHIMDSKTFVEILQNLCHYSNDYILIHTWLNNPFSKKNQLKKLGKSFLKLKGGNVLVSLNKIISKEKSTDGRYQYYRPLKNYLEIFRNNGFQLIGTEENPNKIGVIYIFRKRAK